MPEQIFGILLLAGIAIGGIWGIYIKTKEFSDFVKKNGWKQVGQNIVNFSVKILRIPFFVLIGILYLSGFLLVPLYLDEVVQSDNYTNLFALVYFLVSLFAFYYANGTKRRETKNIVSMIRQDFAGFKDGLKEFIAGAETLTKMFLILLGWLLRIAIGILLIALTIWLILAIGPLWIIAIVAVLIFLVLIGR